MESPRTSICSVSSCSSSSFVLSNEEEDSEFNQSEIIKESSSKPKKPAHKKPAKRKKQTNKLTKKFHYRYTQKEVDEAVKLLNAPDEGHEKNYQDAQQFYCMRSIYEHQHTTNYSNLLDSTRQIIQDARVCLENGDWKNLVQVIIIALQDQTKPIQLIAKNYIVMELLNDPAIKNTEIAKECLLSLYWPNTPYDVLIKNLVAIPQSVEQKPPLPPPETVTAVVEGKQNRR